MFIVAGVETCHYFRAACKKLTEDGHRVEIIKFGGFPDFRRFLATQNLGDKHGWRTSPAIWWRDGNTKQFIGGFSDLQ